MAFHGVARVVGAKCGELFELIHNWAISIGRVPTVGQLERTSPQPKLKPFDSVLSGIKRIGFRATQGFSMIHEDDTIDLPTWGRVFNCTLDRDGLVLVAEKSKCTLTVSSLFPLASKIVSILRPQYGIGYYRDWKLSPYFYAIGMPQGLGCDIGPDPPEVEEEIENISRWGDALYEKAVYTEGILRDVYPWNFLTASALKKKVDDVPLKKWIESSASRGSLKPLSQGVVLWQVKQANIPRIRKVLWDAGIIFNWRNYL